MEELKHLKDEIDTLREAAAKVSQLELTIQQLRNKLEATQYLRNDMKQFEQKNEELNKVSILTFTFPLKTAYTIAECMTLNGHVFTNVCLFRMARPCTKTSGMLAKLKFYEVIYSVVCFCIEFKQRFL